MRPAPVAAPAAVIQPVILPAERNTFGFAFLIIFLFLMFGRLCDFYAQGLHLPLVFSTLSLVALVISGNLLAATKSKIGVFLLMYSGWLVMATPFSEWKGGSFDMVVNGWSKAIGIFLVIAGLTTSQKQVVKVIRTTAYSLVLASFLALLKGSRMEERLFLQQGLYAGPNDLATAMIFGCVYSWFIISNPKHGLLRKAFGMAAMIPLLYVMVQTGSRGALITLLIVLPFLLKRYSVVVKVALLTMIGVGVLVAILALPQEIQLRYLTFLKTHVAEVKSEKDLAQQAMTVGSTNTRLYMLKTSILFTLQHPLFGVGPDQFAVAENTYAVGSGKPKGEWLGTHNTYTQISSESGIPALVLYILCMLACRKELTYISTLCKTGPPTPDTREIEMTAFTLKIMLMCLAVFYMFEHIAYLPLFPALAGLILAFTRSATNYFSAAAAQAATAGNTGATGIPVRNPVNTPFRGVGAIPGKSNGAPHLPAWVPGRSRFTP